MAQDSLSALLDGECTAAELDRLLDEMDHSPALKREFSRLCLAREAQEGTRITKACIAEGVMSQLDALPAAAPPHAKVTDLASRRASRQPLRAAWPLWTGWAAAASMAAVAVLVAVPAGQAERGAASASLLPQINAPSIEPVSVPLRPRRARDLRAVSFTPAEQEQLDELNNFMIEHNSTASEQGMGGTLRAARFAAHAEKAVLKTEDQR